MVRPIEFGEATRPTRQRSLRGVKGKPPQDRWIVLVVHDECWSLRYYELNGGCLYMMDGRSDALGYSELWAALASLDCGGRKTWLIGWRVRYALHKADFLGALEAGLVELPKIRTGKNKGKHGGRLTCGQRVLDVDVICGGNKIKILDWANFGVSPEPYTDSLESVDMDLADKVLRDFLDMADALHVKACKSTAAQLGWNHCRRVSCNAGFYVNLDADARAMERRAYHGGRNECFRLGDIPGTTYSLDVRSCYAAICRDEALPVRLIEEYRAGSTVETLQFSGGSHWIADVVIRTESPDYPLKWNGSPIYPVGEFFTSLPWPELWHAIVNGRVVKVLRAARYEAEPVLREYADWYLQARRQIGNVCAHGMAGAVKSIFNSSLGYTARQKYDWQLWDCHLGGMYWLGTIFSPEDKSSVVSAQVLDQERRWLRIAGEPYEAMPFLHATITSYARVRLLEILDVAGRDNVLYCDTDGILVNTEGADNITLSGRMMGDDVGQLRHRFRAGAASIYGQKTYRVGDQWVAAGVTKTRMSRLAEKRVLTTETGRVTTDGRVEPFRFVCKIGGGKCVNELT